LLLKLYGRFSMSNSIVADVVLGLQHGDEGKGKVTHHLLKSGEYNYCLRFNGGGNAGHTIYHNGRKFVTHYIPSGVFHGIKSIIGPGCVVNLKKLRQECQELIDNGIDIKGNLFVDKRVHITTDQHLIEDSKDSESDWSNSKIGTTKSGNGPTYRDKYERSGRTFGNIIEHLESITGVDNTGHLYNFMKTMVIDVYEEFHNGNLNTILCEGAQGFELDIDWGDYPFVTSSHCGIGSVCLNGIPPQSIRNVYGVVKAYETYVGAKAFQDYDDVLLEQLQREGDERGATTGRDRQTNYLHLPRLMRAIKMNGITHLIVNKCDIFEKVSQEHDSFCWKNKMDQSVGFTKFEDWKTLIRNAVMPLGVNKISFSFSPHEI